MTGTMTFVGLDVHARSVHGSAIDVMTGELTRWRFRGGGVETPVAWLRSLPGPVHACYEAGPTGFGLYRAARAAGIRVDVVAPGKTPRGPADRVKTDRKDAELLARLLLAGQLSAVKVPPAGVEAARELTRLYDACRRDLMTARHRVSKMLLRHGRVYPKPTTWKRDHRKWLADQHFDEQPMSELVYLSLLAQVDGLTARKLQLAEQTGQLSTDERWWPTVARLRCFRGVDTLTALSIHLELGADWARFEKAPRVGAWLGLTPSLNQSRGEQDPRRDHQDRVDARASAAGRSRLALRTQTICRADPDRPPSRPARACARDLKQSPTPVAPRLPADESPRQTPRRHHRRGRP
jgi:transposase